MSVIRQKHGGQGGLADRVVNRLIEKSFKVVAFDFDQTIVKLHTFFNKITPSNVHERKELKDDFADAKLFQDIVHKLHEHKIHVAVASFGYRDVIEAYLKEVIPSEFEHITILSRESSLSKSKMLRELSIIHEDDSRIPKSQIVLFDDDQRNCTFCLKAGYQAYLVDSSIGINQDFWSQWLELTDMPVDE